MNASEVQTPQVHGAKDLLNTLVQKVSPGENGSHCEPKNEGQVKEIEQGFDDKDKIDLPKLEKQVKTHSLEAARAIVVIRQRKLWQIHRKEDGKGRKYATFDQYCEEHLGHNRQWVSKLAKWLKVCDTLTSLRKKGLDVPEVISNRSVEGLTLLEYSVPEDTKEEEAEEVAIAAILQECAEDGLPLTEDNLRTVCKRRRGYYEPMRPEQKPVALTYAEYKADCKALELLQATRGYFKDMPGPLRWTRRNLLEACKEQAIIPKNEDLLRKFTGKDLQEVVDELQLLADALAELEFAKEQAKELKEAARDAGDKVRTKQASMGLASPSRKKKVSFVAKVAKTDDEEEDEADQEEAQEIEVIAVASPVPTILAIADEALTLEQVPMALSRMADKLADILSLVPMTEWKVSAIVKEDIGRIVSLANQIGASITVVE